MSTYPEYGMADYHLAKYLHEEELVQDVDGEQLPGGLPAVFLGDLPAGPDVAVALVTAAEDRTEDDVNPWLTIVVIARSAPWDIAGLRRSAEGVFQRLHDRTHYDLTAGQRVLVSRRISRGPEILDQNRRWQRADTYRLRLAAPTSTEGS